MQPRKPTEQEKKELFECLVTNEVYRMEQAEEFYEWANNFLFRLTASTQNPRRSSVK
jgi:hypothetical protein